MTPSQNDPPDAMTHETRESRQEERNKDQTKSYIPIKVVIEKKVRSHSLRGWHSSALQWVKQVQNPGWTVWAWNLPPRSCPRVMVGGWADYKEDLTHEGSIVLVCYECLPFGRCLLELWKQQLGCFTWMREIIANIWQLMVKIIIMQCIFMLLTPP